MKKIIISNEEEVMLKNYFKTSPIALIRNKSQAVIMRLKGLKPNEISEFLFYSARTISRWLQDFYARRMASIFSGLVDNENANKLTREQKNEIAEILKQPPSDFGLPKGFWDVPNLRSYVEARFGVVYESVQTYHYLLRFSDLSFKYPDTFSIRRDEIMIKKRIAEIRQEIQPYLSDPKWEVLAADEVRIVLEAITRKAWLPKGERTVIKVNQTNEYQSYFGALSQKNSKCYLYELNWQNQEEILVALEKLIAQFPNKKICIIWDNARFHKGKLMQEALSRGNFLEKVHLINFPPYAPDYNPIEHVWNTAKAKLANRQFDSFSVTKKMFFDAINSRTFAYKI
jgi:hypothetical protein